jgi:predicted nucleic acid-binding protein
MSRVLVDSNVLLDIFTEDPVWFGWSSDTMAELAEQSALVVNPIIYAEVSVGFDKIEELEQALPANRFTREPLPWEAGFLAGKSSTAYRKRGGERRSPLPDFYIGAHAAVRKMTLLTRDAARYRTYFPGLALVTP